MKNLLPVHKIILLSSLIGVIVSGILFFHVVSPTGKSFKKLTREVKDLESQMSGMNAPQDETLLLGMQSQASSRRSDVQEKVVQMLKHYEGTYVPAIVRNSWTLSSFVRQKPTPSRDFYMKEFDRVIRRSPFGNLDIGGSGLGLTRESDSEQRYQLLLQLWCVETLLGKSKELNLELVFEETESGVQQQARAGRRRTVSLEEDLVPKKRLPCLTIQPPVELMTGSGESRKARLVELSFQLGVSGSLEDIAEFMKTLGSQGTFFGIRSFEMSQLPPKTGELKNGPIQLNIECVTYVSVENNDED